MILTPLKAKATVKA